jgi:citrate lyase subunit beta/citryl-CoA lyase
VRLNGWGTGQLVADLDAVVLAGVDGVALAKTSSPDDVLALDRALTELELARGLPAGAIEILPMPETAYAMLHRYECLAASKRCRRATGVSGSAPGGDYYRATGYEWRRDGLESLANSTTGALEARAAGIENVLCGPVTEIDDLNYVREVLTRGRELGANGALLIHPSHVAVAHDVYSPTPEQIDEAVAIMRAMAGAVDEGRAAVRLHGMMVDYAHVRTSLDLLELAEEAGLEVPEYPVIDVASR